MLPRTEVHHQQHQGKSVCRWIKPHSKFDAYWRKVYDTSLDKDVEDKIASKLEKKIQYMKYKERV